MLINPEIGQNYGLQLVDHSTILHGQSSKIVCMGAACFERKPQKSFNSSTALTIFNPDCYWLLQRRTKKNGLSPNRKVPPWFRIS